MPNVNKYEQRIDVHGVSDDTEMEQLLNKLRQSSVLDGWNKNEDSTLRHLTVDKSNVYDTIQKIKQFGYQTTPKTWYNIDELMNESREGESFAEETTYYYCDDCDYWHLTNWTPIYWDSGEEDEDGVTWRTLWLTSDDSGDEDWESVVYGERPDDPEHQTDWKSYLNWIQEKLNDPEYPNEEWQEYDPANYLGFMPSKSSIKLEYRIGKSATGAQFWGVRKAGTKAWKRFEDAPLDWQKQILYEFSLHPVDGNLLYDNRNKHLSDYAERNPDPVFVTYSELCERVGRDPKVIEFTATIEFTPEYTDEEVKSWIRQRIEERRDAKR